MKYYPLFLEPIYFEKVWGGTKLQALFDREITGSDIGESWDVTVREDAMSKVLSGEYKDKPLQELFKEDPTGFLGKEISKDEMFPLLVKIIDANDHLSIQVHPNDEQAKALDGYPNGKSEMWYILEAPEDGNLIIGINDNIAEKDYQKALEENRVEEIFNKLPVKKGDVINVPPGLVHALTKGTVVVEIQQNCDITYRIFDYNRLGLDGKPRELHTEKALKVIDFSGNIPKTMVEGIEIQQKNEIINYKIVTPFFAIIIENIQGIIEKQSNLDHFEIFTCVEGEGVILHQGSAYNINYGDSFFIPAALGKYSVEGDLKLLKSFVPTNIENDIILPLKAAGISKEEIEKKLNIMV